VVVIIIIYERGSKCNAFIGCRARVHIAYYYNNITYIILQTARMRRRTRGPPRPVRCWASRQGRRPLPSRSSLRPPTPTTDHLRRRKPTTTTDLRPGWERVRGVSDWRRRRTQEDAPPTGPVRGGTDGAGGRRRGGVCVGRATAAAESRLASIAAETPPRTRRTQSCGSNRTTRARSHTYARYAHHARTARRKNARTL